MFGQEEKTRTKEMLNKTKSWFSSQAGKPKNVHSLEHLRYLHNVLMKNAVITEQNRSLLVETLRSISEILIWGDQNDSSVFDFFLEKNMLLFFLKILRQKAGRFVCVQLLQTLNILFENIRNETSLYYLLSNNYVNSIIVHRFDFSDEEVLAYYISFLKTLSFKLNVHTIHFFYNEHNNDFALYTEAIKFFNHPESMVRIAVRTLTLNVYRVNDNAMLMYIKNKTAVPYFSNLVWFIGNHVLELDSCVRNDIDHQSKSRLSLLVAEHLDHLHYLNDILNLHIEPLNAVLTDHLLNRLLVPLYVDSLTRHRAYGQAEEIPHIASVVALFLLSQVFLIIDHPPLVCNLADIIFNGDENTLLQQPTDVSGISKSLSFSLKVQFRAFVKPDESLERSLDSSRGERPRDAPRRKRPNYRDVDSPTDDVVGRGDDEDGDDDDGDDDGALGGDYREEIEDESASDETAETVPLEQVEAHQVASAAASEAAADDSEDDLSPITPVRSPTTPIYDNSTDEEKTLGLSSQRSEISMAQRPYLSVIFNTLDTQYGDYKALFALCMLYAVGDNHGIKKELLESAYLTNRSENKSMYSTILVNYLLSIMGQSCQYNSRIRPVTLEMASLVLKQLVWSPVLAKCFLEDVHLAALEGAKEESMLLLRHCYREDELFLDMFDDEYQSMTAKPLNVEYLMMDESILLPPTGTPLTGIDFIKRLPSGQLERTRRAIRVFFLLRDLSLTLRNEPETKLPLTNQDNMVKTSDKLDLNNSDLIACTVLTKDRSPQRVRRFLVIDRHQLILVEPDSKRLGWGVARFVGPLQDLEVTGDKDDSRSLHVTIHKRSTSSHAKPIPLLAARFQFDDHIRCMAAKQRLTKGRQRARQAKMASVSELLEIPQATPSSSTGLSSHPGAAVQVPPADQKMNRTYGADGPGAAQRSQGGLFPTADRRHSDPTQQSQQKSRGQLIRQPPQSTGGKSDPKPLADAPAHRGIAKGKQWDGQASSSSPEIEEAHEATSPSAYDPLSTREDDDDDAHFFDGTPDSPRRHSSPFEQIEAQRKGTVGFEEHKQVPASLAPSREPPLSLLATREPSEDGVGSPKLLPPASEERVRSLSGASTEGETGGATAAPPFTFSPKSKAKVGVNKISASPSKKDLDKSKESASESLHRLRKFRKEKAAGGPAASGTDTDSIEMVTISQGKKKERRKSRDDDVWIHVTAKPKHKKSLSARGSLENVASNRQSRKETLQKDRQRSQSTGAETERRRKSSSSSQDGSHTRTRRASGGASPLQGRSPTPTGSRSYSPFSGRQRKSSMDKTSSPASSRKKSGSSASLESSGEATVKKEEAEPAKDTKDTKSKVDQGPGEIV